MSRQLAKHWISADEYERMGEAGIFGPDARLELIEGDIYQMSPIGSPHASCVKFLSRFLNRALGDIALISTQDPIRLNDFSEPQPDVALLRLRDDFYRDAHPTPADVLIIIEVADTTVNTDRSVKIPLYAKAGIREAWLVDIPSGEIEVYAEPADGVYQTIKRFERGDTAQSQTVANLAVSVADVLG